MALSSGTVPTLQLMSQTCLPRASFLLACNQMGFSLPQLPVVKPETACWSQSCSTTARSNIVAVVEDKKQMGPKAEVITLCLLCCRSGLKSAHTPAASTSMRKGMVLLLWACLSPWAHCKAQACRPACKNCCMLWTQGRERPPPPGLHPTPAMIWEGSVQLVIFACNPLGHVNQGSGVF